MTVSSADRELLRARAAHQRELAESPAMRALVADWIAHNDGHRPRPMVHIELDTFEQEVIPGLLTCTGEDARAIETALLKNTVCYELFGDDWVVPEYHPVPLKTEFCLFGLKVERQVASDAKGRAVGHHFLHPISDLEADYEKLGPSSFWTDRKQTQAEADELSELFGDLLPVRAEGICLYAVPTQKLVHLMGMENMLVAMLDCPELFHEVMSRAANDYLAYFKYLEVSGLLLASNRHTWVGNGTLAYTDELPGDDGLTTEQVWGFMDSQETVGISPEMYEEFIFPYYARIAGCFGLLSYGCCEPVHPVWERCVSKYPHLRKVSISPWCDESFMGEALRGGKIIYHRKPSPNFLGVGRDLDEDAVRAHIAASAKAASGCGLEVSQRDVYTLEGNVPKVRRYVEIIREECARHWQA